MSLLRLLVRRRLGMISAGWLLLVLIGALAAPLLAPYGSDEADLSTALSRPTGQHLLGSDALGRDVLSRLLYGAGASLEGVLVALIAFVLLGVSLGLLAGYLGGWLDWLITRAADLVLAIPAVVLLLVVLSIFASHQDAPMLAFGILAAPGLIRVVRAATLSTREELYVDAARTFGLSGRQIVTRHILPRIASQIVVQAAVFAGLALVVQSGLAYLGFGPRPPAPSWGAAVADASTVISRDPWLLVPTGSVIALTVLAFGLLGDAIRDASTERWSTSRLSPASRPPARPALAESAVADPDALLSVRGLSVEFDAAEGPVTVVQDVSLDIFAGEVLGVVGESGCGKTMLAMGILGLLPGRGRIAAGRVHFDGADLGTMDGRTLARLRGAEIGYVAQEPMTALDPTATVGSQLSGAVRRHHGLSRMQAKARVLELLTQVRVAEPAAVSRSYPHQLSGGIAQRAAIALALAGDPRLLIADEPTTALDVSVQAEILALLHTLRRERGLAVLLVTHDWGVVADLCERAVVMYAGQIVESSDVADMFTDPRHPYTAALLASNLQLAGSGPTDEYLPLPSIPGSVPRPVDWPVSCHFAERCSWAHESCRTQPIALVELADGRRSRCVLVTER
jgi:peptide/nickel transport system permease protein